MAAKTRKIDEVRTMVRQRMSQLSRSTNPVQETYLFRDQKFLGIRFQQGIYSASWTLDQTEIQVMRDSQQIVLIDLSVLNLPKRSAA